MRSLIVAFFVMHFSEIASAICSVRWLPMDSQALVTVREAGDGDPLSISKIMSEQTQIGSGKSIQALNDNFTLFCDERGSQCQAVFVASPGISISRKTGIIQLHLTDDAADNLRSFFVLDENQELKFATHDDRIQIETRPAFFLLQYLEK